MTTSVIIRNPHADKTIRIARRNATSGKTESTRHMPGPTEDWVEYIWSGGTYLVISEHDDYGAAEYNEDYNGLPFGLAVEALKKGRKVRRAGWNGKGMWLTLVLPGQWHVSEDVAGMEDLALLTAPWIGMKTADNKFVPWLASQTDVLSEDWQVL